MPSLARFQAVWLSAGKRMLPVDRTHITLHSYSYPATIVGYYCLEVAAFTPPRQHHPLHHHHEMTT